MDEARLGAGADEFEAVTADVNEGFGVDGQADDGAMRVGKQFWGFDTGNERNIGGFDASIGEVEAGGGFGGAGDADQDDIGFRHATLNLAVIMADDVVHGVDAFEIIGIQDVLAAGFVADGGVEMGLEQSEERVQDV